MDDDCGFVIFSGNKLWYSSKEGMENSIYKNKNLKTTNKVRNSAKNKKNVIHPIFEEIMKRETDPYWISFFDDASTGNFPRNCRFFGGCLTYRIKNKNVDLHIPEDPITAVILLKRFLSENAGIISPTDLRDKKIEEEKKLAESAQNEITSWSQIRSNRQQTIMISLFVEKIGEYYNLSLDERKTLIQTIKIGVLAGYFNSDNIIIDGGQIVQINGLEYDELSRQFVINKETCKSIKVSKKINYDETTLEGEDEFCNNKEKLIKHWQKYLKDLNKKNKI